MLSSLQLALVAALVASTHSIFCSDTHPYCSGGKVCLHNECRRYKPNIDCTTSGGKCPRGYCCMKVASYSAGTCVRKQNFYLQLGDLCQRSGGCDYCECQPGLVCAKNGFQFFPEVYTCQQIDPEGECDEDDQCASDRCCSSSKCKPKKKQGEACFPKNGYFPEAYYECNGECEDGTSCSRDHTNPNFGSYVCTVVEPDPVNLCRGS
ncbi:hypothetical protein ACHWQZ_G011252 [Mnemiopsis leidyi]